VRFGVQGTLRMMPNEDSRKSQLKMESPFFCRTMQSEMSVRQCLDLFVEANAFGLKESNCFKCIEGQKIRQLLAHE